MKNVILVLIVLTSLSKATGQKLHVAKGVVTIDTVLATPLLQQEEVFKKLKKWAILNVPDYNGMSKGEMAPELLKYLYITDYWAAMGTRQKYSQDVTIEISEGLVKVKLDNLRTYVPDKSVPPMQQAQKGWAADKFFVNSSGLLKPGYSKFYADVEVKFIDLIKAISASL